MEQSELSELIRIGLVMAFFPLVLGMGLLYMWRERNLQHEERRLMIEKGLTPPPLPSTGRRSSSGKTSSGSRSGA